jgi:HlyD family secretion protein
MKRATAILAAIITVTILAFFVRSKMGVASAADKKQYKVAKVEIGTVKKTVSATGILQPWTTVDIKSKAGGRVDDMLVDVGSRVKVGQEIAKIDPTDTQLSVDQAQADINKANAQTSQSKMTWELQKKQSELAVETAQASLGAAQASLDSARARLETARQQSAAQPVLTSSTIASAQANYESAQKQLDEMVQATHPQERASAKSSYDQAEANRVNAESNLARQKKLMDQGFVSKQVVEQAQANFDVATAQLVNAKQKLDTMKQEQDAAEATQRARVRQAEAQLNNAKAGKVDVAVRESSVRDAQAAVRQAEKTVSNARKSVELAQANRANIDIRQTDILSAEATKMRAMATMKNAAKTLDQTVVRAPSDGVVLKKYVERGTYITSGMSLTSAGASIVQLGDVTKMYVDVTVDETDIANVDEGQAVDVSIEAYPGIPFDGKVKRIDPQAVIESNVTNIHVRVEIDNSDAKFQLLKPGMNATCEFVKGKKENVVTVPADAVRTDDDGKYVEVVAPGTGKPAPPDPKTGQAADADTLVDCKIIKRYVNKDPSGQEADHLEGNDGIEIVNGVKAGETIVTQTIEPVVQQAGGALGGGFPGMRGGGQRSGGGGGGGGQRR